MVQVGMYVHRILKTNTYSMRSLFGVFDVCSIGSQVFYVSSDGKLRP